MDGPPLMDDHAAADDEDVGDAAPLTVSYMPGPACYKDTHDTMNFIVGQLKGKLQSDGIDVRQTIGDGMMVSTDYSGFGTTELSCSVFKDRHCIPTVFFSCVRRSL